MDAEEENALMTMMEQKMFTGEITTLLTTRSAAHTIQLAVNDTLAEYEEDSEGDYQGEP